MPAKFFDIERLARAQLTETVPNYWTSQEMLDYTAAGVRDLWRDIADLKQEHFLVINNSDVFMDAQATQLRGVPTNVHKIYNLEPVNMQENGANEGLLFMPLDYNHQTFKMARTRDPITPSNDTIYYSIASPGGPVTAPTIYVAPKVVSAIPVSFAYVPTLGDFTTNDVVPIPGESTNALVAWTIAFARAKEIDGRSPDTSWLAIYATEKQHLLQSLGLRQYQEPLFADAIYEQYWG